MKPNEDAQEIWEHAQLIVEVVEADLPEEAEYLRAIVASYKAALALGRIDDALRGAIARYLADDAFDTYEDTE